MWSTIDVELFAAVAALCGLMIGFAVGAGSKLWWRSREDRKIEKAGVWRCGDRGYYLIAQNRTVAGLK